MEVETLCSKLKGERPPVEIIEHKSRKRTNQIQKTNYLKSNTSNSKIDEKVNLRKLQNEILKFTTHFDARNTKAKEQLAIKLGAKPRKKENLNYKQLKEKLKQETEAKKNQEQLFQLPKTMVRTSKTHKRLNTKKNKSQSTDIIKNYGTIKNKK
ncbi:uncharacterized protein LOC132930299 [Rhopalosiphum padi]|uniref:uncharacterized protein LOC132930299 n=1 Tax=Rhopalosiphum padi TaxID=40932 RepID=UPI00298E2B20|nr:uncharacterized protein LOC132930299 [Rhopalosiphum padi]